MARIDRLYDWIASEPCQDTDRILAAGLPLAEPPYFDRIVQLLLKRETEPSWAGLISVLDRLPEATQHRVLARLDLVRLGIARAARSPHESARLNAYRVLTDQPFIKLVYLIPDALNDPSEEVRDAAARAFRRMAECFLDHTMPPRDGVNWRNTLDQDQREFLSAVWATVRDFRRHLRIEAFEICLWFARYFDQELWSLLEAPRSHAGYVVREHLPHWDDRRVAGFLMLALRQPLWRRLAGRTIGHWRTLPECRALLQHSDLLDDPRVARQISLIRNPGWLGVLRRHWNELSDLEKQLFVRWTAAARVDDEVRTQFLAEQLNCGSEALRRAALYALGACSSTTAQRALSQFGARGDDGLAHFASWVVLGRQGNWISEDDAPEELPAATHQHNLAEAHRHEFSLFWQMLRRHELEPQHELFFELRENLSDWREPLKRQLLAPDPRDRVLALRLLDKAKLVDAFRDEIEPLLDDSTPGVRGLAAHVLRKALLGSLAEEEV
jgi:HEAT repeat protein